MKKKTDKTVNKYAKDVRTPKYRMRVVADKKKKADKAVMLKKDIDKELDM